MNQKKGMKIKGEYRDVITKSGELIKDSGWKSNSIAVDYGRFLAALMKKEFEVPIGIEYIAVGSSGTGHDFTTFREKVVEYFNDFNEDQPPEPGPTWVWAKKIDLENIKYLNESDEEVDPVTNKLKIEVTIGENEPSEETFDFFEFALVGISEELDTGKMFFINYVNHGQISKDNSMKLDRTIKLTFPINNNEEENNE